MLNVLFNVVFITWDCTIAYVIDDKMCTGVLVEKILTKGNWSTWRKTCPSVTFSTTNLILRNFGSESGLRGDRKF